MTFWRKPPPPPEPAPVNPIVLAVQVVGVTTGVVTAAISWWRSKDSSESAARSEAFAVRSKNFSEAAAATSERMVQAADRMVAASAKVEAVANSGK